MEGDCARSFAYLLKRLCLLLVILLIGDGTQSRLTDMSMRSCAPLCLEGKCTYTFKFLVRSRQRCIQTLTAAEVL